MSTSPKPSGLIPARPELQGMPCELLLAIGEMILDENYYGPRDIAALSLASKSLHSFYEPMLYNHNATLWVDSPAMCWGAQYTLLGTLKKSLDAGGNVNTCIHFTGREEWEDGDDVTPLVCAIVIGEDTIIEWLLAHGASPILKGSPPTMYCGQQPQRPMYWAVRSGNIKTIERLLRAGTDLEAGSPSSSTTAMHVAAAHGHHALIDCFPDIDVHRTNEEDGTPLHVAAQARLSEEPQEIKFFYDREENLPKRCYPQASLTTIDALVKKGATIDARNKMGHTPLHSAFTKGQWSAAIHLMELGAEPSNSAESPLMPAVENWVSHPDYVSAIERAVEREDRKRAVRMVLQKGAKIQARVNNVSMLAHICESYIEDEGYDSSDEEWEEYEVVESKWTEGQQTWRDARYSELIRLLLEFGAVEVNAPDMESPSPLQILVTNVVLDQYDEIRYNLEWPEEYDCSFAIIRQLMRHGASLDVLDCHKVSPVVRLVHLARVNKERAVYDDAKRRTLTRVAGFLLQTAWEERVNPCDKTKQAVVQEFGLDVLHRDDPYRGRFQPTLSE